MLKAILLFIKGHMVISTITTIVVIGTTIVTPIVIGNYMLDKNVKDNLSMLVSSDFRSDGDNKLENESQELVNTIGQEQSNEISSETSKISINKEPLKFRIEKVYSSQEGEFSVDYTQGDVNINNAKNKGIEYKIVPSYDKDYSEWTKKEKEEYQRVLEEISKMAEEDYNKATSNEQQSLENAMKEFERVSAKLDSSYSKKYYLRCFHDSNGRIVGVDWQYNSYTKLYSNYFQENNPYQEKYEVVTKEFGNLDILQNGVKLMGVTREEFRNKLYPKLIQTINKELSKEERQEELDKLNELYHLSD